MIVDVRVGGARNQFASQVEHIPIPLQDVISRLFVGDETDDFYEGLLSGFTSAYQIIRQPQIDNGAAERSLGGIVAVLSQKIINKAKMK